ncbi:putative mediator of RNA polymerase II transcription subunit 15a/b/c [Helianthus debilis subsp. tardiflorus]
MDPPSQEPETSKDPAFHLTKMVKPISSDELISSLTDISSIEKVTSIIPHCVPPNLVSTHIQDETNVMSEYDHEPLQKRKRELSVPSLYSEQFVSQRWDICSTEMSAKKRKKNPGKFIAQISCKFFHGDSYHVFILGVFLVVDSLRRNPAILEEIKKINSKLLETSIEMDRSEDDINILVAHEGTIVKCLFRSVCSLLNPQKGASSEKVNFSST